MHPVSLVLYALVFAVAAALASGTFLAPVFWGFAALAGVWYAFQLVRWLWGP